MMMARRLALTVGINAYPSAPLAGCVNDAIDWTFALAERGYQVTTLLDADATRARITAELAARVSLARWGDRIVLSFSGHGTWVPDRDGDEPDGRDEALCCYDYRDGGLLLDDEMQRIFTGRRAGVRVTILSDSCHSGSVNRFGGLASASRMRARYLPPKTFLEGPDLARAFRAERLPVRGTSRPGTVLLSGCADHEYSYDASFAGRPNGAFTRAAIDTLGQARTVGAWHRAIRERLPSGSYPQSPALTASLYQRRTAAL